MFPGSFMEFGGAGYVSMTKYATADIPGSIYLLDGGSVMAAATDYFMTVAYDCGYLGDKEFIAIWISHRHHAGAESGEFPINGKASACKVYYNVDDQLIVNVSRTTNLLAELNWALLGNPNGTTIVTDGTGTLTTQLFMLPILSGLTKGMRITLKFLSCADVEICEWGILWKPLFVQGLEGSGRMIDPRHFDHEAT
jgi:hypothetical protein